MCPSCGVSFNAYKHKNCPACGKTADRRVHCALIHLHLADLSDRLKDRMQYSKREAFLSIDETPELSPAPARRFVQLVKRAPTAVAARKKTEDGGLT